MFRNILTHSLKMVSFSDVQMVKCSSFPTYKTLAVTVPKPFVVHVELNRPDKRNAMNVAMWVELGLCFKDLANNPDCRVVVLSGAGDKLFTAGLDFFDVMNVGTQVADQEDVARKSKVYYNTIKLFQKGLTALEKCPKPVIAAVHGPCIGGGVDLIAAADIRYCSADAWFQVKEVDIGMAADVGTLQRLPKIVGSSSLVNELCFTARKMLSAEAKDSGLITKVFDNKESLLKGALEVAELIASKSPVAIQGTKKSIIYSRDHTVEEGLEHIAMHNQAMLQSEDFTNAATAQAMKQEPPVFSKL